MTSALSLLGVSKNFGGAQALDSVGLTLTPGRVHALVGENGAGKSTATKILAGLEQPSSGTVTIGGEPVRLTGRAAAIRQGIGLLPQQLSLNTEMTLVENLALTQPALLINRGRTEALLRAAAADAGLDVDLTVPVRRLGLAERQLGELTICLAQGARVLLLDEPTSALGPYESGGLFEKVRRLADAGVAILLITHRLDEVRESADDVTVLSRGRVVLSGEVASVTDDELVNAMLGSLPRVTHRAAVEPGATRLVLDSVVARAEGSIPLRGVSLSVRAGEVVGVLGVAGNGQRALAEAAAGIVPLAEGSVTVDGIAVAGQPRTAHRAGVAYVPEIRSEAILPDSSLSSSAILRRLGEPRFGARGLLRWRPIVEFTRGLLERHDVRPRDPQLLAGSLSGGNQQKLVVGRELDDSPSVAVLHGPTQGLDLHAAAAIRGEISRAAAAGTAVLLVSADVDEVRELADRIVVLSRGSITDEFTAAEFDAERLGRAMAGLNRELS